MNCGLLHSTLRELQVIARSGRFWATLAAVIGIFSVTGPYGTAERLSGLVRLAYWTTVHLSTWTIAVVFSLMADALLRSRIKFMIARMMLGALLASLPISAVVAAINLAYFNERTDAIAIALEGLYIAPLCLLFCLLTWLNLSGRLPRAAEPPPATPETHSRAPLAVRPEIPLLSRMKPENRGPLLHITVEDHYTAVKTTRGRELLLLRFSDALNELGDTDGMQVHRSHWVAAQHVQELLRENGKLAVRLADGVEIPVSRTYSAMVRARFR